MAFLHHLVCIQLCIHSNRYVTQSPPNLVFFIVTHLPVYFFYPETAGRTLEDLDRYFAGDAPLFVFRDKEAIASKRPEKYVENEKAEVRRHSSVAAGDIAAANTAYQRKNRADDVEFHDEV